MLLGFKKPAISFLFLMSLYGRLFLVLLSFLLSGCAISYIDDQGKQNVIGFVNISMEGVEDNKLTAGDKLEVTNFGVLFMKGKLNSGLSIGYSKEVTMSLKNDVLILTNGNIGTNSKNGAQGKNNGDECENIN